MFDGLRQLVSLYTSKFLMLVGELPPKSVERVDVVFSVGDRLTYTLRPDLYVKGGGTGSSYVAELYSLGSSVAIVAVFNFILGFLIVYLTRSFVYKPYGIFVATFIVPSIFWMPRSAFLYPTQKFLLAMLILTSLAFIYKILRR